MRTSPAPLLLELDLTEPLVDGPPTDPVGWLQARRRASLRAVLDGLRDGAADNRVRGLVAKVGGSIGLAQAQEVRDAVREFARSRKPTVAWAETFGELAGATVPYVLASGFEQVWLQPSGEVGITGVAVEATFLRGTLDRIGVEPQFAQRHEYKNAADRLLRHGFTEADREATGRLAESAFEQVVAAVADGRRLPAERVRELIDRAPLTASEAVESGLVDRLGYRDEVYADLRTRLGDEVELRYAHRYRRAPRALARVSGRLTHRSRPAVALISGTGAIVQGRGRRGPFPGGAMGSDLVAAAFRSAVKDDHVKAIVFRVNSPGGSYIASDVIWREVGQARASGVPVVVSMADVAASGGYYVSMAANAIVAEPGTLTGSIGVLGGKAVTTGLMDRLGIGYDAVAEGRHARMLSPRAPFSEDEWRRLEEWLDRVYDDFVGKVAAGRKLDRERAHELARGRVWTGADAAERGLVDELGGLSRAVELARQQADLPPDAELRRWPPSTPLEFLSPPKSSEDKAAASARLAGWGLGWGSYADVAARLGLPPAGPLTMPPLRLS